MTTVIPPHQRAAGHIHTDEPLVQIGWQGQTGAIYSLAEDVAATERGGFSPIYRGWGDECGHQIKAQDGDQPDTLTDAEIVHYTDQASAELRDILATTEDD